MIKNMTEDIKKMLTESNKTLSSLNGLSGQIEKAAKLVLECYKNKGKTLMCGNGGSASQAEHMAAELVGSFKRDRKALPAIALSSNSATITSIGNDYGYDNVFSRQVEGLANEGDVLVVLSTSGNSENIIKTVEKAKELGIRIIGLLGKSGGKLKGMCDLEIIVESDNTPRIQEAHLAIIHIICEIVEEEFFG